MNRYTLSADGHRWWWGPALVGTACTVAVTAIIALPIAGQAMPVPTTRHEPAPTSSYVLTTDDQQATEPVVGQCFFYRAHWNEALDWPQPLCRHGDQTGGVADVARAERAEITPRIIRPGLDWRP
jgi:hypothetical protein